MTIKELQTLTEQIGAHVKTIAELQIITQKQLSEGLATLLAISKEHHRRLDEIQGNGEQG